MALETPATAPLASEPPQAAPWRAAVLALTLVLLPLGLVLGRFAIGGAVGLELQQIALAAAEPLPLMILAVLAYWGLRSLWGKLAALFWMMLLLGTGVLANMALGASALVDFTDPANPVLRDSSGAVKLALLALGGLLALALAALCFLPVVRRTFARFLPIDSENFTHIVMLASLTSITLLSFLSLVVLGEPVLLGMISTMAESGADLTNGRGTAGMLRDTLYPLLWIVPASIAAVGFGLTRDLGAALQRLGLVRPTLGQVGIGIAAAVGMVVMVSLLSVGIDAVWSLFGWPKTDGEAFGQMLDFAFSPLGAVVIGVSAGLGEELGVRGVLQPRAGILLSNLFFVSLHAFQYNWDSLLVVFVVGMLLGLLRKRTNTTTSAIAHGTYDFILVLATVLQIPGLNQ